MAIKRIGKGFEFDQSIKKFDVVKQKAPKLIANNSKNWFLKGFRKGGGQTDDSEGGWKPRKKTAKRNTGRGILVDTGALRRSIHVAKATFKTIIIATKGIAYANRHNEGITDKLGRKMPKREFMGDSRGLNKSNEKILVRLMDGVFRR